MYLLVQARTFLPHFTDFLLCQKSNYLKLYLNLISLYYGFRTFTLYLICTAVYTSLYLWLTGILCQLGHYYLELALTSTDLLSWVELGWVASRRYSRLNDFSSWLLSRVMYKNLKNPWRTATTVIVADGKRKRCCDRGEILQLGGKLVKSLGPESTYNNTWVGYWSKKQSGDRVGPTGGGASIGVESTSRASTKVLILTDHLLPRLTHHLVLAERVYRQATIYVSWITLWEGRFAVYISTSTCHRYTHTLPCKRWHTAVDMRLCIKSGIALSCKSMHMPYTSDDLSRYCRRLARVILRNNMTFYKQVWVPAVSMSTSAGRVYRRHVDADNTAIPVCLGMRCVFLISWLSDNCPRCCFSDNQIFICSELVYDGHWSDNNSIVNCCHKYACQSNVRLSHSRYWMGSGSNRTKCYDSKVLAQGQYSPFCNWCWRFLVLTTHTCAHRVSSRQQC